MYFLDKTVDGTVEINVTNILQNIFFSVQQKKETGLE